MQVRFLLILLFWFFCGCETTISSSPFSGQQDSYELDKQCLDFPNSCVQSFNKNYLEISINHVSPVSARFCDTCYFDVGGQCNTAGFPSNVIRWKLKDSSKNLIASGQDVKCNSGRYKISIATPSDDTIEYSLEVALSGIDSAKKEYSNASLAEKTIKVRAWAF